MSINQEEIQHINSNPDIKSILGKQLSDKLLPTKELLGMQDVSQNNNDMHQLVNELITDINIEGKTDLNKNQIVAFSRAAWFAKRYNSQNMRDIILYLEKYLQSKDRKGRKELVDTISGIFRYELESKKAEKEKIEV